MSGNGADRSRWGGWPVVALLLLASLLVALLLVSGLLSPVEESGAGREPVARKSSKDPAVEALTGEIELLRIQNVRLREEIRELEATDADGGKPATAFIHEVSGDSGDPASGRVRVRVTGPDGQPVDGATIRTWRVSETPSFQIVDRRETTTGEDGTAEIGGLEADETTVTAQIGGRSRSVRVPVVAGRLTCVNLALGVGIVVEGLVSHLSDGPMPGTRVSLVRTSASTEVFRAETDGRGRYRIEAVPPGRYGVRLVARGFRPSWPFNWREVEVPATGPVQRDFVVGVPSIHGTVREAATGRPVPGVELRAGDHGAIRCRTGPDGSFAFTDLPPGRWYLRVLKDGFAKAAEMLTVDTSEGGTTWDVTLHPPVRILFRLRDDRGRPWVGKISVYWRAGDGQAPLAAGLTTDENGCATLEQLAPGPHRLSIYPEGRERVDRQVDLPPGETRMEIDLP